MSNGGDVMSAGGADGEALGSGAWARADQAAP